MRHLSEHDLNSLLAIILRIKMSHEILIEEDGLQEEEKFRLRDELGVLERIIPKIADAILDFRT
jgi:hypothetical protein